MTATQSQITNLPDSMAELQNLWLLSLYNNSLTFLPEWIGDMPSLNVLDLGRNELTVLPEAIKNLHSLEDINLTDNKILEIPDGWLEEYTGRVHFGYNLEEEIAIPNIPISFQEVFPDYLWKFTHYEDPLDWEWGMTIDIHDLWVENHNETLQFQDSLPSHYELPEGQYEVYISFSSTSNSMASISLWYTQKWTVGGFTAPLAPFTLTVTEQFADHSQPDKVTEHTVEEIGSYRVELSKPTGYEIDSIIMKWFRCSEFEDAIEFDWVDRDEHVYILYRPTSQQTDHTVNVTTWYRDGALPEETTTYKVPHGARFEEYYDVLDGYGVGGFIARNLEYGIDEDTRMIYIDPVTQDHNILVEFVPKSYTFTVTTRFQDGSQEDIVEIYYDLPHGEAFDIGFAVPAGYRVRGVQSGSLGIMVDWYAYTVHVDKMTGNMAITILLDA